jgi:AcrR family transcriptional regulator
MGITERKERDKEDLRKSILDAAREVFLEKGADQTSIRSIAQKIEYSPTTIYLYFKDKNEIFYALHQDGFALLNTQMIPLNAVADPFERLTAMGRIYLKFAEDHPDYYDLMFVQKSPMDSLEEDQAWNEGQNAFDGLKLTIQECMDRGFLPFTDAEVGAFVIWSTMHGMCVLDERGRCKILDEEKREHIVEAAFEEFVRMLECLKG